MAGPPSRQNIRLHFSHLCVNLVTMHNSSDVEQWQIYAIAACTRAQEVDAQVKNKGPPL